MRSWLDVPVNTVLVGQLLSLSVTVTGTSLQIDTSFLAYIGDYRHIQSIVSLWKAF